MAVRPPQVFALATPFTWVGREAILAVSGTFAAEEIAIEFNDGTNWVPTAVSGDPGYLTAASSAIVILPPGVNARITNFGGGSGSGLVITLTDIPEGSNVGGRKLEEVA